MKTTRMALTATLLTAILTLTACDPDKALERAKSERADRLFQAATADYSAGRLDEAIKGFEGVVRADPSNASARFQLACLMQDAKHDNFSALCHYHEFLTLFPTSDKAAIASDRIKICERLLANELAEKYKLNQGAMYESELKELKAKLKSAEDRVSSLTAELRAAREDLLKLGKDNERMHRMVAGLGEDEDDAVAPKRESSELRSVRDILDEDEDGGKLKLTDEARALNDEAEREDRKSGDAPSIIAPQAADAKDKRDEARAKEKSEREEKAKAEAARPKEYVVAEGDTLYKIAIKFYGRSSAWKEIREANKATITTDGRVRAGQKIILP